MTEREHKPLEEQPKAVQFAIYLILACIGLIVLSVTLRIAYFIVGGGL